MRKLRFKSFAVALAAMAVIAAGCGDDNTTSGATTTGGGGGGAGEGRKVGLVFDIGGRGDKSFNDSAAAGLDQAIDEFGIDTKDLSPAAGGENREELLRLLTEEGFELNFAVGFLFGDSVTAVSAENPDTNYAIIDSVVDAPNVASLTFAEEQGSFLVGAAAALKSETGKIGFIGGVNTELIHKFEAGFVAGAEEVNPDIEIEVTYLTEPPDFSGFSDPAKGKAAALGMYGNGADVVYHAAGGSGLGLFQAAQEVSSGGTKVWAIGVDSDQYESVGDAALQEFILTSMEKKVNVAVFETIKAFVEGDFPGGTVTVFDLESGGIDYSKSGGFVDDIADQLDELKQQIIDGDITVPTEP